MVWPNLNTLRVAPRNRPRFGSDPKPPAQGPIISLLPRQQGNDRPETTLAESIYAALTSAILRTTARMASSPTRLAHEGASRSAPFKSPRRCSRNQKGPFMSEFPFHPLADLFPLIEGEPFDEMVEDIRMNGQRDDIVTLDHMILDGRNRFRACRAAEVEPRCRVFGSRPFDGNDPEAFVISANIKRRHLNASQCAMIAADLGRMRQGARTDLSPSGEKSQRERAKRSASASEASNAPTPLSNAAFQHWRWPSARVI